MPRSLIVVWSMDIVMMLAADAGSLKLFSEFRGILNSWL